MIEILDQGTKLVEPTNFGSYWKWINVLSPWVLSGNWDVMSVSVGRPVIQYKLDRKF